MKLDFLRIESFKRGIIFSSAFGFISKFLLFLQSIAIAYYFGTQTKTDIFFYCYGTITLLAAFVNNLDVSVLIPEAMRLKEQEGMDSSKGFLNFFIYGYAFIGIAFTVILFMAPIPIFDFFSKFDSQSLQEQRMILLLSIPLFSLMIVTNLLVNILASFKYFTIPMIIGSVNGVVVLFFLVVFHEKLDMLSALVGLLLAYTVGIVFLSYLMKSTLAWNFTFKALEVKRSVKLNIFFAQAGNVTSTIASYMPLFLLSGFAPGIITSLTYGQRIAELPNQLITTQVSSVVGIKFNELYAKGDLANLREIFSKTTRFLLFVLLPISTFFGLYSNEIIAFCFERGAFNVESVRHSSEFLKYLGFLLPSIFINTIISRLFMATQKVRQAFWYQIVLNAVTVVMMIILITEIGTLGYPIALLAVGILNILFCYFLARNFFPFINYLEVLTYLVKVLLFNGAIALVLLFLKKEIAIDSSLAQLALGSVVYGGMLLLGNGLFNLNEDIRKMFQIKFKTS